LGLTWFFPPDDSEFNRTASQFRAQIMTAFGGMIAEKMKYGEAETGVGNDIKTATSIARGMVLHYGMSSLGPVSFSVGYDGLSNQTIARIDTEVERILNECYSEADALLKAHEDKLDKLGKALLLAETLQAEEVYALLGLPPRESVSFSPKEVVTPEESKDSEKAGELK
jgi:cell division protease FtsH